MSKTTTTAGGMGFIGWLQILFIALKLLGKIEWSWWWVVSPFLATLAFIVVVLVVAVCVEVYK